MFAARDIAPSTPLFRIPGKALLNLLTLEMHYPKTDPPLSSTQLVSLHLLLHRPTSTGGSKDPLFGPFIDILPEGFDGHPLTWLIKQRRSSTEVSRESELLSRLPPSVSQDLERVAKGFLADWDRISAYLVRYCIILATFER
jgi:hypothetical protein